MSPSSSPRSSLLAAWWEFRQKLRALLIELKFILRNQIILYCLIGKQRRFFRLCILHLFLHFVVGAFFQFLQMSLFRQVFQKSLRYDGCFQKSHDNISLHHWPNKRAAMVHS